MGREELIQRVNDLAKLVHMEYGITREKMATILGIAKKTLVEWEKGPIKLGWAETVALATIFSQSRVLQNTFGGAMDPMIAAIALDGVEAKYPDSMSGKVWWSVVFEKSKYKIQ